MNIDRITLPIDDENLQNQIKFQLIQEIVLCDITEYGVEHLICDTWDEDAGMRVKAYTGERVFRIKTRTKEKGVINAREHDVPGSQGDE